MVDVIISAKVLFGHLNVPVVKAIILVITEEHVLVSLF